MSDPVGEWKDQTGLGFGNKAKRQQPGVSKRQRLEGIPSEGARELTWSLLQAGQHLIPWKSCFHDEKNVIVSARLSGFLLKSFHFSPRLSVLWGAGRDLPDVLSVVYSAFITISIPNASFNQPEAQALLVSGRDALYSLPCQSSSSLNVGIRPCQSVEAFLRSGTRISSLPFPSHPQQSQFSFLFFQFTIQGPMLNPLPFSGVSLPAPSWSISPVFS